ncbi:MAG: diacylglycerol/polyprenol kinase family protein [Candidatus Odinarchaeota archaeon]
MSVEFKRKLVHIGNGTWTFILPFIDRWLAILIVLVVIFLVGVLFRPGRPKPFEKIFYGMARENEIEIGFLKGPFLYVIMIFMLILFFDFRIAGAAFACMAFGDGFATLIGIHGKIRIKDKKTLEGSLAFFIAGTVMSGLVFWLIEIFNTPDAKLAFIPILIIEKTFFNGLVVPFLILLVIAVFIAMFLELFLYEYVDDNILVPVVMAVMLTVGCYLL